ncbi:Six-hairpin glycosidase [Penicillium griseofulvum]|uniref:Six-hairpin glycosidase n=1 Tax=Penicillium patulum TaxID=5078 RepID=A0A135LUP2_PENPA|nr:Six-hairpin glycosidase [Penicillium griseofulvum]KXG52688.1 Six-hairpin glycosidase [Penicillium griseofulvum]
MDSKLYLAENVLNERRPVTYRLLSRALKVNANRAKHLLFEFHRNENAKKPQTVHATYVISGIQKAPEPAPTNSHADDEDDIMDSSPYLSSSMPNQDLASDSIRTTSIVLAREEDLEDAKSTFQSISTIHVYSLEPTALPDLNVLVDSNREIARTHGQEDPLECGKQWGMIQNRNVKRRTGARPPPPAAAPAVKAPAAKPSKPTIESTVPAKRPLQREASSKEEATKSDEPKSELSSAANSQASSKPSGKAAPVKQKGSGNLFSSFAKAKPKAKVSAPAEPAAPSAEDVVLDDASEEEAEELFPDSTDKAATATRENRKEREERLKKMMDDDDDDEADDEEMPDADEEPREPTPVEQLPPSKPAELKEEVTVQGGRRRGKRQVMMKKTVKDEEGYLVTREEATWESFSEDEPVPKKKPAVNVSKGKAGKAAGQVSLLGLQVGALPERDNPAILRRACPDYTSYASTPHAPYSGGPLNLPFQRPAEACRTFSSPAVEKVINDMTSRLVDKDLAQLFRNAFPNTLDTTIRWHTNGSTSSGTNVKRDGAQWSGVQTFIVTGDINAEWLRDSTNQLTNYQTLAAKDKRLYSLILGAINTQSEFVIQSPYCNAFQPPALSGIKPEASSQKDTVHPAYDESFVFECKYELDSLAHFLQLGTEFHENTGSTEFLTDRWYKALNTVLKVVDAQSQPTFNAQGQFIKNQYTFERQTTIGTETLSLAGVGNPLNGETGLIRSAFRPSDDATILGFFIPPNAMMSVQLQKTAKVIKAAGGPADLVADLQERGTKLAKAVRDHGIVQHPKYGDVYAFEVDGYGSRILMDDANIPSLLSLPYLGFVDKSDTVYQNTRKMITDKASNPYYLVGPQFHGIGGPHIGLENAWPMSLLVQAMTSDDDAEIIGNLNLVRNSSLLGLVHESINVTNIKDYTRPWFSWANSVFAQTVLKIAAERPHLIFGANAKPYTIQ